MVVMGSKEKERPVKSTIWFTSDTHFYHERVIELSGRPFKDLKEMHRALIVNWNKKVSHHDMVYVLGDFCLGYKTAQTEGLLSQLNGQKMLVRGNHDHSPVRKAKGWAWVKDYYELKVGKLHIVLFHYPISSWNGQHRGAWHLHGHSHGSHRGRRSGTGKSYILDVGCDVHSFAPISLEEVERIMKRKNK